MKRFFIFLLLGLACGTALTSVGISVSRNFSLENTKRLLGSIFFVESTTTDALRSSYTKGERIKVLIVPGHDETGGTEFLGIREADMNVELAEELAFLLSSDPHFEPVLVRSRAGYAPEFTEYFKTEAAAVRAFVANKKQVMKDLLKRGFVEKEEGVIHNNAPSETAYKLYSLNKWANENGVDVVIHVHFNDYPGRKRNKAGRYKGFAVYVPDKQYSNARPSRLLASSLALELSKTAQPSNHPQEGGIVSDQELIAVGSFNTLDAAVALIEYGYIYENRFRAGVLDQTLKALAEETYDGLNSFFKE